MSDYPLIADHGLIGDLQTAALVTTDGTIDWFCCPAVRLAERVRVAARRRAAAGTSGSPPRGDDYVTKQLYFPDTAILITRFMTEDGVGEVIDFMPIAGAAAGDRPRTGWSGWCACVRGRDALRGRVRAAVRLRPRDPRAGA